MSLAQVPIQNWSGALAEVFFEAYDKGCFGVITTHYANIKTRAAKLPEAQQRQHAFQP